MPFNLSLATLEHIPGIAEVWRSGFNTPEMQGLFPDTPTGREWTRRSIEKSMTEKRHNTVFYIITEDSDNVAEKGKGRVVSFARWIIQPEGSPVPDWRERWETSFPEDMNPTLVGDVFFDPMARQHALVMANRQHYCKYGLVI